MLTFKKVLEVFKDYLAQDTDYEVVLTKHGYTVMGFDNCAKDWNSVEYCETPEDLRDELLDSYRNYLEYITTRGRNHNRIKVEDVTEQEAADIQSKVNILNERCRV